MLDYFTCKCDNFDNISFVNIVIAYPDLFMGGSNTRRSTSVKYMHIHMRLYLISCMEMHKIILNQW